MDRGKPAGVTGRITPVIPVGPRPTGPLEEDPFVRMLNLTGLAVTASLAIAACGGGASPPASEAPASQALASQAPASSEPSAPATAACEKTNAAAALNVSIKGFKLPDVTAGVDQPIEITNQDSTPHTATVDDGSCNSGPIAGGAAQTLIFHVAGTYPYHCEFHKSMRGTITISG